MDFSLTAEQKLSFEMARTFALERFGLQYPMK